ncbi:MAG: hypothetical protein WBA23_01855 [Tunicatimonas sp.]|uniref:hypothetical protein n=1 Tax=Tunicatimonas sp. TaxID=1940096 RepID=UPI003C773031
MSAIRNVQFVYDDLCKNPQRIVVNAKNCVKIWNIFDQRTVNESHFTNVKPKALMQASLTGAIDASNAMGYVEALFRNAYKPTATMKGIIKAVIKEAIKQYLKNGKREPEELYRTVIGAIRWAHKPRFDSIRQNIDLN